MFWNNQFNQRQHPPQGYRNPFGSPFGGLGRGNPVGVHHNFGGYPSQANIPFGNQSPQTMGGGNLGYPGSMQTGQQGTPPMSPQGGAFPVPGQQRQLGQLGQPGQQMQGYPPMRPAGGVQGRPPSGGMQGGVQAPWQTNMGQGAMPPGAPQMPMHQGRQPMPANPMQTSPAPMPSSPMQAQPASTPMHPPAQNMAGAQRKNTQPSAPFDKLKQVGTFMGYPEYTLPENNGNEAQADGNSPENQDEAFKKSSGISAGERRQASPELSPQKLPMPTEIPKDAILNQIKEFCQNEKNAAVFYKHLSKRSIGSASKEALLQMAEKAGRRSNRLKELYRSAAKIELQTQNRNIRTEIDYKEGLRMAIKEENTVVKDCMSIMEKAEVPMKEKLSGILLEKYYQVTELKLLLDGHIS